MDTSTHNSLLLSSVPKTRCSSTVCWQTGRQWIRELSRQGESNHCCEKFIKKSCMPLNALATTVPARKSESYAQTSSRPVKAKEALTCGSRSRSRCKSCSNSIEAAVRHKRKAAEQEESAVEVGKSISQLQESQYVLPVFTYGLPVRSFN